MSDDGSSPPTLFEAVRHMNAAGREYWTARELAPLLGYADYRNFQKVIAKAQMACANSNQVVADHFGDVTEMIALGKGARRAVANGPSSGRPSGSLECDQRDRHRPTACEMG